MPQKKKSPTKHLEASTSFRLGREVLKRIGVMAREESKAKGSEVTKSDIVRWAVTERYRKRKRKT